MKISTSQIIRIAAYNAIYAGVGVWLITYYVSPQYIAATLLLLLAGLVVLDSVIDKKGFAAYGFKMPKWSDIKYALAIFAIFFPISIASRLLFPNFDFVYANALGIDFSNYVSFLIFTVPLAILNEEIGIRALFQSKMTPVFGQRLAVYATIISFALLHFSWAYSLDMTNFLVVLVTVLAYSAFLAFLFSYTKNIFATLIVHLLTNVASTYQTIYHITGQLFNETLVWLSWGILFIIFFPTAIDLLRKAYSTKPLKLGGRLPYVAAAVLAVLSLAVIVIIHSFGQ